MSNDKNRLKHLKETQQVIDLDDAVIEEPAPVSPPKIPPSTQSPNANLEIERTKSFQKVLQKKVTRGTRKKPIEIMKPETKRTATPYPKNKDRRKQKSVVEKESPFSPDHIISRWKLYKSEQAYDSITGVDRLNFEGVVEMPVNIEGSKKFYRFGIEMSYLAQGLRIIENEGRVICDKFTQGERNFKMHEVMKYGRKSDRASTAKSTIFIVLILRFMENEIIKKLETGVKI